MVNFVKKLAFGMAAFALASSAAFALTISATAIVSDPYDGAMTPVQAVVSDGTATSLTLHYRVTASSVLFDDINGGFEREDYWRSWHTTSFIGKGNGTDFLGYLPALPCEATFQWYVSDGSSSSPAYTTTVGSRLDYDRFHDGVYSNANTICGWSRTSSSGSNYVARTSSGTSSWVANGIGWSFEGADDFQGMYLDEMPETAFPMIYIDNLPVSAEPYIRSPKLEGGVGTIDFRSMLNPATVQSSSISVQIATTDDEPGADDWIEVASYDYGLSKCVFCTNHIVLNDRTVTYVRIFRTGPNPNNTQLGSGRIAIDNICITKPPADVGIVHKLENPGYPSQGSNVLIRCSVTNVVEATAATNRAVTCFYQYVPKSDDAPSSDASKWLSTPMAYCGVTNGMDWYEGTIGGTNTGYVWYYYRVDFDGYCYGINPLTGDHESLSPAYWENATAGEATIHDKPDAYGRYQVRSYTSRYGRVAFEATDPNLSQPSMTLVDDDTWQCVVPVTGQTVVSNYFCGYGFYEDDADSYSSDVVVWGENDPPATLTDPTLAGYLESSLAGDVTNRLVALNEKNYTGFYLYRFASDDDNPDAATRHNYIVKKAVYQDFDDWTASQEFYEESLGGLPSTTYAEDFDGNAKEAAAGSIVSTSAWNPARFAYSDTDLKRERLTDDDRDVPSDKFEPIGIRTGQGFYRTGSRILEDRRLSTSSANKSLALQLYGQIENLGSPYTNTTVSIPYGLEKIAFKARASIDDDNFTIYKNGTAWTLASGQNNGIYLSSKWYFSNISPSKPYLSYILLYQPKLSYLEKDSPATWYELRVIKDDDASVNADDNKVLFELWMMDSSGTRDKKVASKTASGYTLVNDTAAAVNLFIYNNSGKLCVWVNMAGGNPKNSQTAKLESNTSDATVANGGTIGFGVFDAVPVITAVNVGTSMTGSGSNMTTGKEKLGDLSNSYNDWSHGGYLANRTTKRWDVTSSRITRMLSAQTIGVYIGEVVGDEERILIDNMPAEATFTNTVSSLSWTTFDLQVHDWDRRFVILRYDTGDGGVVVDDLWLHPWRACTGYELALAPGYRDWKEKSQQREWLESTDDTMGESMLNHWAVLEGNIIDTRTSFSIGAEFTRSRANPALDQSVVSPEMTNGVGSVSFSYSVTGTNVVVYGVEWADRRAYANWTPVAVYTNGPGSGTRYVKIGETNVIGRVRIRVYGPGDTANYERDYPDCGYDPSWGGTEGDATILIDNIRVKDYPANDGNAWIAYNLLVTPTAAAGLIYNNDGSSCFLNNSPTDGTYGSEVYDDDDPYLQSPPLYGVGVGEIAFQYRLVPDAQGNVSDGNIIVKVSKVYELRAGQGEWTLLTNIVLSASGPEGSAFVKFDDDQIFDEDHYVVRFYNVRDTTKSRVVIDNVLVTAPARPSFEFEYVRLSPVQPLAGSNTTVEAKIMRQILSPQNIHVYCSYHVYDTNDVNEVWGYRNWFDANDTSCRFELASVGGGVYRAENGLPDTFETDDIVEYVVWGVHDKIHIATGDTPIWQGADSFENPEWYKTYNTVTEQVEVMDENTDYESGYTWSPYFWVYSCPPGSFFVNEIKNWRTSTGSDAYEPEYIEFAAPAGTDVGNWRLMVVQNGGDNGELSYDIPDGTTIPNDTANPAGWGFFLWADEGAGTAMRDDFDLVDYTFTVDAYLDSDSSDYDIEHLGTDGAILVYRSNGAVEQMVKFGREDEVEGDWWTWAGRHRARYSISLESEIGEGQDLVPGLNVADFKWPATTTATAELTPRRPNEFQEFADVGYVGPVVQSYYAPSGAEITDANIIAWIEGNHATQGDIDALGSDSELNTLYLLNQDLTKACTNSLNITSVAVDGTSMRATATLTRTEDGVAVGTRAINGRLVLEGAETLSGGFYQLDPVKRDVETLDPVSGNDNADFSQSNDVDIHFLRLRITE